MNEENLNTFLKAVWEVTNSHGTQESQGETPVMSFTLSTKRRLGRMASACNPNPKVRDVEGLRQGRHSQTSLGYMVRPFVKNPKKLGQ